jgi:hypothetical protein
MRGAFGHHSQVFSRKLSDEQLDRWSLAAARVMSDLTLGQSGALSAQLLYTAINAVRSRVNLPETWEPPAPVTFGPRAVGQLVIENNEGGVRLLLRISGELNEDVMVFGQEAAAEAVNSQTPHMHKGLSTTTILHHQRQPKVTTCAG